MSSISEDSKLVNPKDQYVIEGLFPRREVHILSGPSGAGKTRWWFQIIDMWQRGEDLFGRKSYPDPYLFVSCDRSMESLGITLEGLGLRGRIGPMVSLVDEDRGFGVAELMLDELNLDGDSFEAVLTEDVRVVFIDAIDKMVPKGRTNDYQVVSDFLIGLTRLCQRYNLTVIGTRHTTKVREGNKILSPREKMLGSVAWAGFCSTVAVLEPVDEEDEGNRGRKLSIFPRNAAPEVHMYAMDDKGRVVEKDIVDSAALDVFILSYGSGDIVAFQAFKDWGNKVGVPERTLKRWLKDKVGMGLLRRMARGVYVVIKDTSIQ